MEKMIEKGYIGKFKIGQIVYRQQYGIGNWVKGEIEKIYATRNKKGWLFHVKTDKRSFELFPYGCNGGFIYYAFAEESTFKSLADLKRHWINFIEGIIE